MAAINCHRDLDAQLQGPESTSYWDRIYPLFRPLRMIIVLTTITTISIIVACQFITRDGDNNSFMTIPQAILTAIILAITIFSFVPSGFLSSGVRIIVASVSGSVSLAYSILPLVTIQENGGCTSEHYVYAKVSTRCTLQYVLSGFEIVSAVLLLVDVGVSIRQNTDKEWQAEFIQKKRDSQYRHPDM